MQAFIDSKYAKAYNGRYTTDEEITGMLIAVLFAGQHTSSVTSTWTLLSMLANQVSLPCQLKCFKQQSSMLALIKACWTVLCIRDVMPVRSSN